MQTTGRALLILALLLGAAPARAVFHLWDVTEIYSNADGSIQFIEFSTNVLGQGQLLNHQLASGSFDNLFVFPSNLGPVTANHSFLVATPGFAAIAGFEPDYTLLGPLFFDPSGDTVTLIGADGITFGPGELPLDGILSLNEPIGGASRSAAPNSPTNFAGQTGAIVPEPASGALLALGLLALRGARRTLAAQ